MLPDWVPVVPVPPAVESILTRTASALGVDPAWVVAGAALLGLLVVGFAVRRRRPSTARASARAHERARERDPPVELGETYEFGVREFTVHHSGSRVAVGKVEGFVLFASDVPDGVAEGDVIRARVLSFNRGRTSADATFVGSR